MEKTLFKACAIAAVVGGSVALLAYVQLLLGGELITRALAWPLSLGVFPVFLAAICVFRRVERDLRVGRSSSPDFQHTWQAIRLSISGVPTAIKGLSVLGLSVAILERLLHGSGHAELSDGLTVEELRIAAVAPLCFYAVSAPLLWSTFARRFWSGS